MYLHESPDPENHAGLIQALRHPVRSPHLSHADTRAVSYTHLDVYKRQICEKGAHFGNNVSHSHRKTPKMWKSNVKSVRVKTEGGAKRMYVCTSCLKSGRVERA